MTSPIYTLNDSYFDQIDSEVKAYFLGLLYADGCNYEDIGRIKIDLVESDSYVLDRLKDEIQYTGIISHYSAEAKTINGKSYEDFIRKYETTKASYSYTNRKNI